MISGLAAFNRWRLPPRDAPHPFLTDVHEPMREELTLYDLPVDGTMPPELDGHYLRTAQRCGARSSSSSPNRTGGVLGFDQRPARAGVVDLSRPLSGPPLADVPRMMASDGYQVALALSEVDRATRDGLVLVADTGDGKPLGQEEGPFRLVVSDDLRPARSARRVRRVEVLDCPHPLDRSRTTADNERSCAGSAISRSIDRAPDAVKAGRWHPPPSIFAAARRTSASVTGPTVSIPERHLFAGGLLLSAVDQVAARWCWLRIRRPILNGAVTVGAAVDVAA